MVVDDGFESLVAGALWDFGAEPGWFSLWGGHVGARVVVEDHRGEADGWFIDPFEGVSSGWAGVACDCSGDCLCLCVGWSDGGPGGLGAVYWGGWAWGWGGHV